MPITLKGSFSTTVTSGTSFNMTVPSQQVAGDLLVMFVGSYNASTAIPSGWTKHPTTKTGTGTYSEIGQIFYLQTSSNIASTNVLVSSSSSYISATMLCLSGHDTTSPMHGVSTNGSTTDGTVMSTNALTTTVNSRLIYWWTEMSGTGTAPAFSYAGGPAATYVNGASGSSYKGNVCYINNSTVTAPGSQSAAVISSTASGAIVGMQLAVAEGNAPPVVSAMSPNMEAKDNRTSSLFTWTSSNPEGDSQNAAQIRYRLKDAYGMYPGTPTTFLYTGTTQTYVVPAGVTKIRVDAYGAQGGGNAGGGGSGGQASGDIDVTPGETLYVNVGGFPGYTGNYYAGGFNGGGNGENNGSGFHGGGGGGATDVRRTSNTLANRIIVAAGGGGKYYNGSGGYGGGLTGGDGGNLGSSSGTITGGFGATQSSGGNSGGSLGQGGSTSASYSGGGGGGYYGGGGGTSSLSYSVGGGGGSSYIGTLANASTASNVRLGHGEATITPTVYGPPPWTTVNTSGTASHTFAANTFTLGKEYEWSVRVSDTVAGWGEWKDSWFMAGVDIWHYGDETTTATTSGTIPNLGVAGEYYVEVRTADAEGFGPWSETAEFIQQAQSNVWVKEGGVWKLSIHNVKEGGTWNPSPSIVKL